MGKVRGGKEGGGKGEGREIGRREKIRKDMHCGEGEGEAEK